MFKRSTVLGAVCATLVVAAIQHAPASYAQKLASEQVVRFGMAFNDIATLDPHTSVGTSELPIVMQVYEGLVEFPPGDMNGDKLVPGLAEKWETSADKRLWTFHLRRGVQWHKGFGEFTADDVKFSIERVMSKEFGSPFRQTLQNIERVDIVNPHTVRILLKQPDPSFVQLMVGYQAGYMMSKKAVEKNPDVKLTPVGTGPFVMGDYKPRESVTLVRNDSYWRGKPIVERIVYQFMPEGSTRELALKSGEVSAIGIQAKQDIVDRLRKGGFAVELTAPANTFALYLNTNKKPLDDIRVRKALAHATNRDNMVEFLGKDLAKPEFSALPIGYTGHIDNIAKYPYDLARAKALLTAAGLPNGFSMSVNMSNSNIYLPPLQVIQEQWKKIGVNVELKVVDHPTYHRLIRQDANPVVLYGAFRYPMTGQQYFDQFYAGAASIGKSTAITNFMHYGDTVPGVDDLLAKASYNPNGAEQLRLWGEVQKKVALDAVSIPLYTQYYAMARSKSLDLGFVQKSFTFYRITEKSRLLAR
jgi:peptide/nickel transport system substrate-binding protein